MRTPCSVSIIFSVSFFGIRNHSGYFFNAKFILTLKKDDPSTDLSIRDIIQCEQKGISDDKVSDDSVLFESIVLPPGQTAAVQWIHGLRSDITCLTQLRLTRDTSEHGRNVPKHRTLAPSPPRFMKRAWICRCSAGTASKST